MAEVGPDTTLHAADALQVLQQHVVDVHEYERYDGARVVALVTSARSTREPGVCERDEVTLTYSAARALEEVVAVRQFHVRGDVDDIDCGSLDRDAHFFAAQDALDARLAWHAVTLTQRSLEGKTRVRVKRDCQRLAGGKCPSDDIRIDPDSLRLLIARADERCDSTRTFCYRFFADSVYCAHFWIAEARLAWSPSELVALKWAPEKIELESVRLIAMPANQHDCWHDMQMDE